MIKRNRIFLILGICAGASALALAFYAFRSARHETEFRNAETRKLLISEASILAARASDFLKTEERNLSSLLRNSDTEKSALLAIQSKSPHIRQIFMTDRAGQPLFPGKEDLFYKSFGAFFFDPVNVNNGKQENDYSTGSKHDRVRLLTQFGIALQKNNSGWIPWVNDNRLHPVLWTVSAKKPDKIIGAELELMSLLSRILQLFPQEIPPYFCLELADTQNKVIYAVNPSAKHQSPDAIVPVNQEMLPGWHIRGYVIQQYGETTIILFNVLQIASFVLVLLACGGLLIWLARRELELAGQQTSFVANVSHELKTPLTSIRMYAEMLREKKDKLSPEKQDHYLSVILSESERLSRLISNVLNFSRMEAGQKKYNWENLNLHEFLNELSILYHPGLERLGIKLTIGSCPESLQIKIDRDSLTQIMDNLISNASKYAADGKDLNISVVERDKTILVNVADRGAGIPISSRSRIFNKFYRCDNSLTAESKGSGLGLSIARGLIRDQGGDLLYSPREGGGSVFTVVIPNDEGKSN